MNYWGNWNQTSQSGVSYWPSLITTSGSAVSPFVQAQQLAPVLESPSARLDDREWLDAQIAEVCELAEAA